MLEKLFESLDSKVFTKELRKSIESEFNEAVETQSFIKAENRIEEKIADLDEKSEEHIEHLTEKSEEYTKLKEEEIINAVDKYLDRAITDFVTEANTKLEESVKGAQSDMLIEAFDSLIIAAGIDAATIVEGKDTSSAEGKLEESSERYDASINENIELLEENKKLIKMGVIYEMQEGLTLVESEKFKRLAELVEFTKDGKYADKLETIKESVIGTQRTDEDTGKQTKLNERIARNQRDRREGTKGKSSFSHLI